MSGSDFRILIVDPALKQVRRLACRKGVIVLALFVLVVLPMCWAHSRTGVTTVIDRSEERTEWALPIDAPTPSTSDATVAVWSELPGAAPDPSSAVAQRVDSEPSVESFTVYSIPTPSPVSPASAGKQQLVEEVQRRLARMTAGLTAPTAEQLDLISPSSQAISRPVVSTPSPAFDANTPLQLLVPAGWNVPAGPPVPPKAIAPAISRETSTVNRRDPNLNSNPAASAAFTRHCEAAQAFQQQGQYARAVDAFTLALAYRPTDANAYLGKGLALFAAGQYIGSASALARAVELDSQAALKKIDLVRIAGGPDEFIARFNDLARTVQTNPSPEQQFLLAYVYYQADQLEQARTAIEAARTGAMSPASVEKLSAAINR